MIENCYNLDGLKLPECPYYAIVPRQRRANLVWRAAVRRRCLDDLEFRAAILQACKEDPLFFFATFLWVLEPRDDEEGDDDANSAIVPFLPWVHQEMPLRVMAAALGKRDLGMEKSRAEGATWMVLAVFFWAWLFRPYFLCGLFSKDEDAVDSKSKPGSLMSKLDWLLTLIPAWMLPDGYDSAKHRNATAHTLVNPANHSCFSGFAATANAGTSDRFTAVLMDELAKFAGGNKTGADYHAMTSVQHTTNCRFLVSTPFGDSGAYYDAMHDPDSNMVKVILRWEDNPTKNQGLYKLDKQGHFHELNRGCPMTAQQRANLNAIHEKLRRKGHQVEDKLRSPWYDRECLRSNATPKRVAQDLDRDYGGSVDKPFSQQVIKDLLPRCQPPRYQGMITFDVEQLFARFQPVGLGAVKVWTELTAGYLAPLREYVAGADISAGTAGDHSSNSSLMVFDRVTGEQVLEFAAMNLDPKEFARHTIAICKWFNSAFLCWEANGPFGTAFGQEVERQKYRRIYLRAVATEGGNAGKKTMVPGFYHNKEEVKYSILADVLWAGVAGEICIRSEEALKEFREYAFGKGGKIIHVRAEKSESTAAQGKAHGDRAIALAMALIALRDRPRPKVFEKSNVFDPNKRVRAPWSCPANRMLDRREQEEYEEAY